MNEPEETPAPAGDEDEDEGEDEGEETEEKSRWKKWRERLSEVGHNITDLIPP